MHDRALGDLERDVGRDDRVLPREVEHEIRQVLVDEILDGYVDGDRDVQSARAPAAERHQRVPQHPPRQVCDPAGLLDGFDELGRRQQPKLRMPPTDQRLRARDGSRAAVNLGLERELELVIFQSPGEIADHPDVLARVVFLPHPILADDVVPLLGIVSRDRRATHELGGVGGVIREGRDPDAGLQRDIGALDGYARTQGIEQPKRELLRVLDGVGPHHHDEFLVI